MIGLICIVVALLSLCCRDTIDCCVHYEYGYMNIILNFPLHKFWTIRLFWKAGSPMLIFDKLIKGA